MKIHWNTLLKSIPELKDLEPKERRKIWRQHSDKAFKHWEMYLAFFLLLIWGVGIGMTIDHFTSGYEGMTRYIFIFVESLFVWGIGFYFVSVLWIHKLRPYLKELHIDNKNK